jgi:hypothetical protein
MNSILLSSFIAITSSAVSPVKNSSWPKFDIKIFLKSTEAVSEENIGIGGFYSCFRNGGMVVFTQRVKTDLTTVESSTAVTYRSFWGTTL